jgi:hypothetical protein
LLQDANDWGISSREEHLVEHFKILHPRKDFAGKYLSEEELSVKIELEMQNKHLNIHFHTFTLESLNNIISKCCDETAKFTLELIIPSINEIIVLLNKNQSVANCR